MAGPETPLTPRLLRLLRVALVVVLVAAFATYVWPTLYRYDHLSTQGSTYPVRINRLNGNADMLVPDEGWVPVEGTDDPSQMQEHVSAGAVVSR